MKHSVRPTQITQTDQTQEIDEELKNNRDFAISTNSFLKNMYTYPSSEIISVRVVVIFLARCLLIADNLITASLLSQRQPNSYSYSLDLYEFIGGKITLLQIVLGGLNVALIAGFAYLKINVLNPKMAGSKIIELLEIAVDGNMHLNGFLLLFGFPQNMVSFVLAFLLTLYSSINFRNYIIKTDLMYFSSINYSITFEGITFIAYLLNSMAVYFQNQKLIAVIIIFHCILYVAWYLSGGYKLFIFPFSKNCLAVFIGLEICCGFLSCEGLLIKDIDFSQRSFVKISLVLFCILFSFKAMNDRTFDRLINRIKVARQEDIIQMQLQTKTLKNELSPIQYELTIIGLIKRHQMQSLDMHRCVTNSSQLYDSSSKSFITLDKLWFQSQVFFRFYLRQLFQSFERSTQSIDFQLKYCEFMLNEQPNQSLITQAISFLQRQQLNFLQKKQLSKMKQIINQKVSMLNKNLYEGSLQLQSLIISENLFDSIEAKLKSYLHKNITLWKIFAESELNISSIKKLFRSAFKLIKEIDRSWSYISKYFCIHKRWKYLYITYMLYIKNSKIKSREMQEFGGITSVQKLFKDEKIYYDPFVLQQEIVKNKYLLFDSNTSVFHATMEHSQLFIKRVSQYFTSNFRYKTSEIIGANVSILLPEGQRKNHMEKVLNWINTGYETNQQSYQIKYSNCLDHRGNEIPVLKCFKTFINYYAQQLEYVCLLKKNIKQAQQQESRFTVVCEVQESQQDNNVIGDLIRLQKKQDQSPLSQQNNIFIKEDCYLPVKELKELKNIKILIRFYAFLITLSVLILALLNYQSSTALVAYSSEYINFMQTYRLPMLLANDYYKSILKIGNQTKLANNIKANSELLRSIQGNSLTMQTLFDRVINQPANYYPMKANSINQNSSYSQIQLYFLISSSIATLSNNPTIDTSSRDFQLFHDYLRPGYDSMLNKTKSQFHETFKTTISNIYESIFIAVYMQVAILIFFLLVSLYKVFSFFQRIKSIVTNIAEFKPADVNIIYHYWCNIFLIFERLINKNNLVEGEQLKTCHQSRKREFQMKDISQLKDRNTNENINLNRKEKIIKFNKQANRFKGKIFLLILLAMIVSFSIVIAIEINFIQKFSSITEFERDGFAFLQYFPAATIVGFGCLQKSFSVQYPHIADFQTDNYDDVLSDLWLVGNFEYLGSVKDPNSLYYTKQRKYFFENPCNYNPNVTIKAGLSVKQCEAIADSSFTRGLTAFMRYAFYQSTNCIKGDQLMSQSQLDQFSKSVAVLSAYILDAIVTWGNEFNTRITSLISSFFHSNIIEICLIIGIHIVVFELIILKELKKEYKFYRLLYLNMVPQYILVKDKIIKQKFVSDKIIELN